MESFGAIALLPTIIVLVVALITHRTIESRCRFQRTVPDNGITLAQPVSDPQPG